MEFVPCQKISNSTNSSHLSQQIPYKKGNTSKSQKFLYISFRPIFIVMLFNTSQIFKIFWLVLSLRHQQMLGTTCKKRGFIGDVGTLQHVRNRWSWFNWLTYLDSVGCDNMITDLGCGKNSKNDPNKCSSTAYWSSQSGQQGLTVNAEWRASHLNCFVK